MGKPKKKAAASKAASKPKPKSKSTSKHGPFLTALLEVLRKDDKRKKPVPAIVKLLAKPKLAADLRAFLEVVNEHDLTYVAVGELWLEPRYLGLHVPDEKDDDKNRNDVFMIGTSPGGDPWVVDKGATGKKARVTRIIHDDGWVEGDSHDGFEALLSSLCKQAWEDGEDTDLDATLKANGMRIRKG